MDTKNVVVLVGRLTADPELKYLESGQAVASFGIAVNRSVHKGNGTYEDSLDGFFDCALFGGEATTLAETCPQGTLVQLQGSLRQNVYETKGEQPRKIKKVEIRVATIARVVTAPKKADAVQPAPPVESAQPAATVQPPPVPQPA